MADMMSWDVHANSPQGTIFGGHFDEDDSYRTSRPKGMRDWLIVYTLEGEGYFRTPAGEKRCAAGQVGVLRSGVPHAYGTVEGMRWNFLWAHFQQLNETGYLPYEEMLIHELPEGVLRMRVRLALQNLLHDSRIRAGFWQALCENALREVILLIAGRLKKRMDDRIEQTLALISRSMREEIRVDALAKAVGLSPSRLSHLFKQETGMPVLAYANGMRLRQAALLMEQMGRTATEASLDVGFNNYNHFADLFRKTYGASPREYAKRGRPGRGE